MKDFYYFCFYISECAPVFSTLFRTTSCDVPRLSSILYHKTSDKLSGHFGSAWFGVSWSFVHSLPLVCGPWKGQNVSVLQSPRHVSLGIHQRGPLAPPSTSGHSCEQSPCTSLWCPWKALSKANPVVTRKCITLVI